MTATILLVRHAVHTQYNQRLSGRTPGVPLSEAGRAQAQALAGFLSHDGITRVECSPLDRTRATAEAIAAATGAPLSVSEDLLEIDMGDWTGRALDSFGDDAAWRAWNAERGTARIPGGESMGEAQTRIARRLAAIAAGPGDPVVALVTHSDMIRAAIAWVLGLPLDNLLRFDIDAASVSRLVAGDWGARMLSVNERVR